MKPRRSSADDLNPARSFQTHPLSPHDTQQHKLNFDLHLPAQPRSRCSTVSRSPCPPSGTKSTEKKSTLSVPPSRTKCTAWRYSTVQHVSCLAIDYRCQDRKKLPHYEASLVSLDRSWLLHFQAGVWNCQIPNKVCRVSALHFSVKISSKPLTLDLMLALYFFFFQKGLLSPKRVLQINERDKSCRKTIDLQTLFCSRFVQNQSKEAAELAR